MNRFVQKRTFPLTVIIFSVILCGQGRMAGKYLFSIGKKTAEALLNLHHNAQITISYNFSPLRNKDDIHL